MMPAVSTSDGLEPGSIVDARYRIEQEIGRGNMATVYLAVDELASREVALKVMSERLVGRADRVQRFFKEHELGAEIGRHENIVATLAHGRLGGDTGTPYLVMERIVGPSLDLMLAMHERLDPRRAVEIALGVAKGLETIHAAGVVHRDVKPSNVLVAQLEDGTEVAKLLDFGLAIRAQASRGGEPVSRLTLHAQIPGSAGYMAPEVMERAEPQPSIDVFGFGMLLAELLTGRHPFEGLDRDEYLAEVAPRDWVLAGGVLDEIEGSSSRLLVSACTQRRPDERPSMADVVLALEGILEPPPTAVDSMAATNPRGEDAEESHPALATPAPDPPPSPAPAPAPAKRRAWLALLALLVIVTVGVGVAVVKAPHSDPAPAPGRNEVPAHAASMATLAATDGDGTEDGTSSVDAEPSSSGVTSDAVEGASAGDEEDSTTGDTEPASERRSPRRKKRRRAKAPDSPPSPSEEPVPPPREQPAEVSAECELLHDSIAAMRAEGGWSRVLFLIKANRGCFERLEYRRLRVEALARMGKHEECVKAGAGSKDPEIEAWVDKCRRNEP